MTEYLFTYGFLKTKYSQNPLYRVPPMPITWVGLGLYPGAIYRVAAYPGVKYKPNNSKGVAGDVYMIRDNPTFLKAMDDYELSKPFFKGLHHYVRRKRPILINGETLECWVYEYAHAIKPFSLIKSGNY